MPNCCRGLNLDSETVNFPSAATQQIPGHWGFDGPTIGGCGRGLLDIQIRPSVCLLGRIDAAAGGYRGYLPLKAPKRIRGVLAQKPV